VTHFKRSLPALVVVLVLASAAAALAQVKETSRVRDATTVFSEIMSAPDGGIPKSILDKAEAIAIFPGVIRAGLAVGGQFGHGLISVRNRETNAWSAPAFLTIAGGSFGLQIGGQSIDLVLVIMDKTGVDRLLGNQFKIGAEASAAAGPVGRSAEAATDIQMRAKILSYSRSRGLFAGVALNGSTLAADEDANRRFYGQRMDSREVVQKASPREDLPAAVGDLRKAFGRYAG
jgi:SH3 domain-containing YSC84-like protein 1